MGIAQRIKNPHTSNRIKDNFSDKIFNAVNFIFASIFFIAVLYPIIYIVASSFSDPVAVIQGRVRLWPVGFSLMGYEAVFSHSQIISGFINSIWYMVVGTLFNLVLTVLAAYPLSRKDLYDKNKVMLLFAFTMLFSGGMIPTFMLVRNLGLIDTRWALILPWGYSVFNIIVTRTFFQSTIPDEMLESAQIDGCNDLKFLLRIAVPLAKPIIAVNVLLYALGHWNAFFSALIYLHSPNLFPLQLVLREVLLMGQMAEGMVDVHDMERAQFLSVLLRYSLIVVASAPFMLLYPLVQKFFVKGMMVGAIKG